MMRGRNKKDKTKDESRALLLFSAANANAEAPVVMWKAAVNQEREVKTDGGRNDERAKRGAGWREEGASGENVVMAVQ